MTQERKNKTMATRKRLISKKAIDNFFGNPKEEKKEKDIQKLKELIQIVRKSPTLKKEIKELIKELK